MTIHRVVVSLVAVVALSAAAGCGSGAPAVFPDDDITFIEPA